MGSTTKAPKSCPWASNDMEDIVEDMVVAMADRLSRRPTKLKDKSSAMEALLPKRPRISLEMNSDMVDTVVDMVVVMVALLPKRLRISLEKNSDTEDIVEDTVVDMVVMVVPSLLN